MAIIETKNLTYTYPGGTKPSISNVSIKVEKGEFVSIMAMFAEPAYVTLCFPI